MNSHSTRGFRRVPALRFVLLSIVAVYPFVIAYGNFAGIEPLDPWSVSRALAGSLLVAFFLYASARFVIAEPDARALCVAIVLLAFGTYGLTIDVLWALGLHGAARSALLAAIYVPVVVAVATVTVKPWRKTRRDLVPVILVAVALVGVNGYRGVERLWQNPAARWTQAANEIVDIAGRTQQSPTTSRRDIYYIVLDAFGRADTLRNDYGLDLQDFVDFLHARGFYVAEQARSNYAQTLLSFSSFLNAGYLDALSSAMGRDNVSWLPLADTIQRNALMRMAKTAGYQVVAVGSDYGPTKRFNEADVCFCEQRGLDMFEQVVIGQTVFGALPLDRWTYGAHRQKILDAFSTVEHLAPAGSPRFVFVHILSPHPPFTFAPDGSFQRPDRAFMFNEGNDFLGPHEEYVRGYHDQAEFMTRRLRQVIEAILNRPGPPAAIVIHGDHGPGSMLQQDDAARSNLPERMNIFAVYYLPGAEHRLYPSMTPVNGARALANEYFGTDLPRLPDESWFSPARHPFDFTAVPAEAPSIRK